FTLVMEAKSVITHPSGQQHIQPGFHEIRGLAWSGRGRVTNVEVSLDGGRTWQTARLQEPVLPKCHTIPVSVAMEWTRGHLAKPMRRGDGVYPTATPGAGEGARDQFTVSLQRYSKLESGTRWTDTQPICISMPCWLWQRCSLPLVLSRPGDRQK